ncbi:Iwr1p Ecym_3362 [Eremothecium cymbalariae DBVPG|uniref:Transcription factor Iwr1 domain-containing protein n=1 Tax=Eremothecium cymbalariae (strain CBS 270.75 / DBVPG 7215 / KCTC 17166 / NRRL Y-17582) TaxID=931890 RepID=G8JRT0_ERECY|nr:Hypothetical protein Ecym_3362 [Eremothecium cymbalariae DBVPG\
MKHAPEVLRVKRRRDEDSFQTLLLEEEERSSKKGKYVFKLAKTVDHVEGYTPLLKLAKEDENKVFVLEQHQEQQQAQALQKENEGSGEVDEELPLEISEMLEECLKLSAEGRDVASGRLKAGKRHSSQGYVTEMQSLEYVYDVYIREVLPEDDEFVLDEGTVGYIRIVEEQGELLPDEDELSDSQLLSDDEDSNEEHYYRNDYPDDEDDDRSILFGSESEYSEGQETRSYSIPCSEERLEDHPSLPEQDQKTFDPLFESLGGEANLLSSLNTTNYVDLDKLHGEHLDTDEDDDDMSKGSEASFKKYSFFPNEEDDPMATHRDKVFAKLQRMIDQRQPKD